MLGHNNYNQQEKLADTSTLNSQKYTQRFYDKLNYYPKAVAQFNIPLDI